MFAPRDGADVCLGGGLSERTSTYKPRVRSRCAKATPLFQSAIARVLRSMREAAGLSQCELANALGLSQAAVKRNERGHKVPRVELCWAWALACGRTLESFAAEVERLITEGSEHGA